MGKDEQSREVPTVRVVGSIQTRYQIRLCQRPYFANAQIRSMGLSQIDRHLDPCYPRNSVLSRMNRRINVLAQRSFQGRKAYEA